MKMRLYKTNAKQIMTDIWVKSEVLFTQSPQKYNKSSEERRV